MKTQKFPFYTSILFFGEVLGSWVPSFSLAYEAQTNSVFLKAKEEYKLDQNWAARSPECMEIADKYFQAILGTELTVGAGCGLLALLEKRKNETSKRIL
jgi:hypothetical protein